MGFGVISLTNVVAILVKFCCSLFGSSLVLEQQTLTGASNLALLLTLRVFVHSVHIYILTMLHGLV